MFTGSYVCEFEVHDALLLTLLQSCMGDLMYPSNPPESPLLSPGARSAAHFSEARPQVGMLVCSGGGRNTPASFPIVPLLSEAADHTCSSAALQGHPQ